MEPINSIIDPTSKIFSDVYIRDSKVGKDTVVSDRSVIISSAIEDKVTIGRECSLVYTSFGYGSFIGKGSLVKFSKIGRFCDLSWQLSIGGSNHNYKAACMYTDSSWKRVLGIGDGLAPVPESEYTIIGNDVWLGAKVNIIRGVKIGDGAVIGANSLVLHDIPPYAIAVGSPARVIKYRFDESVIEELIKIKWWEWDIETIREASEYLRGDLDERKLDSLKTIARERENK